MITPGVFRTYTYSIKMPAAGRQITLAVIGDVHWGVSLFSKETWDRLKRWVKRQDNLYILWMGDYIDLASSSERNAIAQAARTVHDQNASRLLEPGLADTISFCKELDWIQQYAEFVGFIEGNHYAIVPDEGRDADLQIISAAQTTTELMCKRYNVPYLGTEALINFQFDYQGAVISRKWYSHHGAGAGATPGGSLNRVAKMRETIEADVYVMGHNHDKGVWSGQILTMHPSTQKIVDKNITFIRSGSFLKSREDGQSSYNSDAARGALSLGWSFIRYSASRPSINGVRTLVLEAEPGFVS